MALDSPNIRIAKRKAAALSDATPKTIRTVAAPLINPVGRVEIISNTAIAATTVTVDTTASGGGVDALLEGVGWAAGATAAASATALAAAIEAAIQVHNPLWTATAAGAVITITLVGAFATGEGCTMASDAPVNYMLEGAPDSELETFTLWQWGDGYDDENAIDMVGNDLLYIFIYIKLTAASATTRVDLRLRLCSENLDDSHQYFQEVAEDIGVAAADVLPVDLPITEYHLTVAASHTYRKLLTVPVDMELVQIGVHPVGLPDADDQVGIQVRRMTRDSVTTMQ